MEKENFTKYETARILGARALQIAMDAPLLKEISEEELENINYDSMEIAKIEFESDVLPISVKKPLPKKRAVKLVKIKEEKDPEQAEEIEEKEIAEKGEIMELANPEDEAGDEEVLDERESNEELQ